MPLKMKDKNSDLIAGAYLQRQPSYYKAKPCDYQIDPGKPTKSLIMGPSKHESVADIKVQLFERPDEDTEAVVRGDSIERDVVSPGRESTEEIFNTKFIMIFPIKH